MNHPLVSIKFITVEVRFVGMAAIWRSCFRVEVLLARTWLALTGGP
jgi:hypothetical protein